ncbi:thioredoxin-like protein [Peziza echinospora]|nr:thioredoxin-like protein [Peziza echinospora]
MVARVQHPAPAFKGLAVIDGSFEEVKLEDYKGKWLVLAFIPMAWTFVCPTEIIAYSDAITEFTNRGASVIFASVDSEYSLLSWSSTARKDGGLGSVKFPLFSDKNHKLSADYGVLIEEEGVALRGIFLIDPNQVVRQITINDLPVGRSVDETIRLIDAFQFVEKYGEVCPANWKPGEATMKDNPTDSKQYFNKVHG